MLKSFSREIASSLKLHKTLCAFIKVGFVRVGILYSKQHWNAQMSMLMTEIWKATNKIQILFKKCLLSEGIILTLTKLSLAFIYVW